MGAMLRVSVTVAVIAMCTCSQAIPLAMITMRKSIHGFPLLTYMGMELISLAAQKELRYNCVQATVFSGMDALSRGIPWNILLFTCIFLVFSLA